jgi:hypothetical protein
MLQLFRHRPQLTLINQNYIDEEIKTRLISGNAYCYSVQNLLSSHLLAKNVAIIISLLSISTYSCCSHLEHKASVKSFVSLQFLNLKQSVGLLGWGISPSQGHYLNKHRINGDKYACLEWDSNLRSQCSSGRKMSCLRWRGHCDRLNRPTQNYNFPRLALYETWSPTPREENRLRVLGRIFGTKRKEATGG